VIHQKLKALREAKGLSQEELATALNLGTNTISNIETGKKKTLDISLLQSFADYYEIPITELLTDNSLTMNFHEKVENGYINQIQTLNQDNKELVNTLREQLVEKDKQIKELIKTIQSNRQ
jgi:transcriptional regulator with XRE-family HTH domain